MRNLKDYNSWKLFNGQIKISERVYLRSELGMEDHLVKKAVQEVAEKLKN